MLLSDRGQSERLPAVLCQPHDTPEKTDLHQREKARWLPGIWGVGGRRSRGAQLVFRALTTLRGTVTVDVCPHHRTHSSESDRSVNHGLWVATRPRRFMDCNKCTLWWGVLAVWEAVRVAGRGYVGPLLSARFCSDSKTALGNGL